MQPITTVLWFVEVAFLSSATRNADQTGVTTVGVKAEIIPARKHNIKQVRRSLHNICIPPLRFVMILFHVSAAGRKLQTNPFRSVLLCLFRFWQRKGAPDPAPLPRVPVN